VVAPHRNMPDQLSRSATFGSRQRIGIATVAAISTAFGSAVADEAKLKAYGRHLAQECTSCHRVDGVNNGIPSIVGWPTDTFIATIKFYREGSRSNPVMVSVASSLSDHQLDALAAFFASLPKPAPRNSAADKKGQK
jgi:cytochrome c553